MDLPDLQLPRPLLFYIYPGRPSLFLSCRLSIGAIKDSCFEHNGVWWERMFDHIIFFCIRRLAVLFLGEI